MRIESCRVCGSDMKPDTKCSTCNNYVAFRCENCGMVTDIQIHSHYANASTVKIK